MSSINTASNNNEKQFSIGNRKYLGSKRELAPIITEYILKTSGLPEVFFDVFSGTGAVSSRLILQGIKKVIVCDNLYSNTVIFTGFFRDAEFAESDFISLIGQLNDLPGRTGYITEHFSDIYFTRLNCMRMDSIREAIEKIKEKRSDSEGLFASLLASFLLAVDRVANTLGQYDAFLKHIGAKAHADGRHVIDTRVYERFLLRPLRFFPATAKEVYTDDIFNVVDRIRADTAYLDPPYNQRQYCDNYHVLENLARWLKPPLYGKTKKFDRTELKSQFSQKRKAREALTELLRRIQARHIYLSYNSEGILTKEEILAIIAPHTLRQFWEIPYPVFGKGAGVAKKRTVVEYIFYFRKD
jgi:adenine-specific DNA-methyltransferase